MQVKGVVRRASGGAARESRRSGDRLEEMLVKGAPDSVSLGIEGAEVKLLVGGEPLATLSSGRDGRFEFHDEVNRPGATLVVRASKEGFQPREVTCPLEAEELDLEIPMEPQEIRLKVAVHDSARKPLGQVRVLITLGGRRIGFALSDESGVAAFDLDSRLKGRHLNYKAERRGFRSVSGKFELKEEGIVDITLRKRAAFPGLWIWGWRGAGVVGVLALLAGIAYLLLPERAVQIVVLRAEPAQIHQRSTTTLIWATLNAKSVILAGKSVPQSGSLKVRPTRTTEFTLVASNGSSEGKRTVTVEVAVPERVMNDLVLQFMKVYSQLRTHPAGAQLIDVADPFQALVAAGNKNGLLEADCRNDALDFAIDTLRTHQNLKDQDEARKMAEAHLRKEREALRNADYRAIFKHISECKDFCRPLMTQLVLCHVQFVAQHHPGMILFPTNSKSVSSRFSTGLLARVSEELVEDPAKSVWLMGRASKLGPAGFNQKLSLSRAAAVRDNLIEKGVSPDQIHLLAFSYEPPQITHQIARSYGVEELFLAEGEQYMNQSVVVVAY